MFNLKIFIMKQLKVFFVCILLMLPCMVFAQSRITGNISDPNGEPIIGASVAVKGTTNGTITDMDGNFVLSANNNSTLVVSFIGFRKQEVNVAGKSNIRIVLLEDTELLDEVVVVGYGTQKKATLTGSVEQVKGDVLIKKATTNVANALQGEVPGLVITRTSSRPGNEGVGITLRGGISVNKTEPMILVDGVEAYQWELSQINPNDIESISVLKDASAAIYGNRAGGGVILITTKRGKEGKTTVTYSGRVHANVEGKRFPVADGVTWAKMAMQAADNDSKAPNGTSELPLGWGRNIYEQLALGKVYEGIAGSNWAILDPYADQFDAVYGTTYGHSHNITITGGNEKVKALTSLGFVDDRSLIDVVYDGQKKYNFRTNVDYAFNDFIKTEFNVSYDRRINSTPTQGIGDGIQDFYIFPLYNPYGQFYDTFGYNNVLAKLIDGGTTTNTEEFIRLGGKVTVDLSFLTKGLSVSADGNIRIRNHRKVERQIPAKMYDWSGERAFDGLPNYSLGTGFVSNEPKSENSWVKNTNEDVLYQVYGGFINYNRTFGEHTVALVAGMTAEKNDYKKIYTFRKDMSVDELDDINLGSASTSEATGGSNQVGLVSYLGRLNYDYKGIYLLDFLFRRDGSSKFASEHRWANFAGVSGGVRFSEFDFVKKLDVFSNLKLRASYGETGSQTGIKEYDYISTISTGSTVFGFNGNKHDTSWISSVTSRNRTWERVANTNIALDFGILNNRLNGTFEYFIRENKGMLISMTYPQTYGASAPKTNSGNFKANGWELSLNWRDRIGKEFEYHAGFTLSDSKTKVTKYNGAVAIANGYNNKVDGSSFIEGKPLNALYVYKTNGYLQSAAEVAEYYKTINGSGTLAPVEGTVNQLMPGSVRKVDLTDDGKITTDDLYYYGDANPHYLFGINLGASYKGFDFSMFIQGVGQQYMIREGSLSSPFAHWWTNQNATFWGNTWTEDNTNARYPAMSRNGARNDWNYKQFNDINVSNIWYARAKNMVLGYTIPKVYLNKLGISNLRLYVSADNLFEFSNVKDGFDPESKAATGQGNVDVYARTLSFGIDLTF